jgi:regulator of RNase E activity RraA
VRWDCEVEVFGRKVQPGQLIHADKHGFLVIPDEDVACPLEAARFMDAKECNTLIATARSTLGRSSEAMLAAMDAAAGEFGRNVQAKFARQGEWS